jgi:hypothetical protein
MTRYHVHPETHKAFKRMISAILAHCCPEKLDHAEGLVEYLENNECGFDLVGICNRDDTDFKKASVNDDGYDKMQEYVYQYTNGGYSGTTMPGTSSFSLMRSTS